MTVEKLVAKLRVNVISSVHKESQQAPFVIIHPCNHRSKHLEIVKTRHLLINLVEAGPLLLFLILYRLVEPSSSQDWLVPYLASAGLAACTMSLFWMKRISSNPVFIGINVYLLSGAVALATRQSWLNQIYEHLQSSGMLAWVVLVGAIYLLFSPRGFIGIHSNHRQVVTRYSIYLLLIAIFVFSLAYLFRNDRLISEFVPFAILFACQSVLKYLARRQSRLTSG